MFRKYLTLVAFLAGTCLASLHTPAFAGKSVDAIKARGQLRCGIGPNVPGFSAADSKGAWAGFDVDICRAVAAAMLGNADKVKWMPVNASQRFAVLQAGEIDMLSRVTSWTMSRDASLGLTFTGATYYDGQAFMVPTKSRITSAKQLKGATVCVQGGTTTEKNLSDYSRVSGLALRPVVFDSREAANKAYFSGRCQAYTHETAGLASIRSGEAARPEDHVILPELISKEPLGPSVRRGDDDFTTIVKWVVFALIEAEEAGITQANAAALKQTSKDPVVQRILGSAEDTGAWVGLDKDWALRAISAVGNYGEVFERNLGSKSPLHLNRGLNRLWNQGGLVYAPPIR